MPNAAFKFCIHWVAAPFNKLSITLHTTKLFPSSPNEKPPILARLVFITLEIRGGFLSTYINFLAK